MVDRIERVLLTLVRALRAIGEPERAARTLDEARRLVGQREADIEDPGLRASYRGHPIVRALEEAAR
jgi:hypothetical protein